MSMCLFIFLFSDWPVRGFVVIHEYRILQNKRKNGHVPLSYITSPTFYDMWLDMTECVYCLYMKSVCVHCVSVVALPYCLKSSFRRWQSNPCTVLSSRRPGLFLRRPWSLRMTLFLQLNLKAPILCRPLRLVFNSSLLRFRSSVLVLRSP